MRDQVKEYYGKILQNSGDLKTSACCTDSGVPKHIRKVLAEIHGEVLDRYYGCGLLAPQLLEGSRVLDLGCGAGRDCYVLSRLVGENGFVLGVDMTPEQLTVAKKYVNYHTEKFGYREPNVEFQQGYIERLNQLDLADNSFDIIVSNCVINLSPDKEAVFREAFRVLKPGGELYFSDVYADRRVDRRLIDNPVLYGECLSGALYWNDFLRLVKRCGFLDPRLVSDRPISIDNEEIRDLAGHLNFYSATYRLFKLEGLESDCEDYGHSVVYKGSIPQQEETFELDKEHRMIKDLEYPVCGNTYRMLKESRFAPHFEFSGDWDEHRGIFDCCGQSIPFDTGDTCCDHVNGGSCCAPAITSNLDIPGDAEETEKKKRRGYIQPHALKELWFHTGTVCNLKCAFCYEDSKPGDKRIGRISFKDAHPFIDEAVPLGVERFSFTGGEPFVVKDLLKILDYALELRPCMVLTNGTDPLLRLLNRITRYLEKPNALSFRISIDHPGQGAHDKGRGEGNFSKALKCMQDLHQLGFKVSVARHYHEGEDTKSVEKKFRQLFHEYGLPEETNITRFPDLLKPGARPKTTKISEDCMTRYHSEESRREFMCAYSKMVLKQDGQMRVYACTLVDDNEEYDLGRTLTQGVEQRIYLDHHRCFGCFSSGVSCSEG
ncbi:methyltransferase domain-containing protein [Fibrobacterota bacterium]